jgi:two-component system CheB/CheR fusion protein
MLARLFEPFSQADSGLQRKRSGLGLGLALTKALAELHGGSVAARSDGPGKGAELTLRLPLGAPGLVAAPAAKAPPALRALPRRILVVEDNADAAHTLKDALEASGHEVHVAMDGEEALGAARAFSPDVILCDIGLPSLDGYQLAQRFRADEQLREALLVAVTGYAGPDDQQRAARAGFDRHFAKPPDLERLCLLIAHQAPERATRS